jgi:hypothetical protein
MRMSNEYVLLLVLGGGQRSGQQHKAAPSTAIRCTRVWNIHVRYIFTVFHCYFQDISRVGRNRPKGQ